LPVLLMFAVLLAEQILVRRLLQESFQKANFTPIPTRAGSVEHVLRTLGLGMSTYAAQLGRFAQATWTPEAAEVIVHRGTNPFVGAGEMQRVESMALTLEPPTEKERRSAQFAEARRSEWTQHGIPLPRHAASAGEPDTDGAVLTAIRPSAGPRPFTAIELLDFVSEEMVRLRSSGALSPSLRLHELRIRHQLLVPANRLIANLREQSPVTVLTPRVPPVPYVPLADARIVADRPREWMRYFECYQVETWDRDLAVSCFLHVGLSRNMLYLEWVPLVLFPVKREYKALDTACERSPIGFGQALAELVRLPAVVVEKVGRFRAPARASTSMTSARYGSLFSLRELGSAPEFEHYFQAADAGRYMKILSQRMTRAVGKFLESQGYSVVDFMKQAEAVVNNVNIKNVNNGTMNNSAMGSGARAEGNVAGPNTQQER
jgi:hypothetical protein